MNSKKSKIIIGIVIYLIVALILRSLLPDTQQVLHLLQQAYQLYGYGIVFLFSFLEGIFIVGMFVPGTAIVMFGATLAGKGLLSLPLVIMAAAAGLICGSLVSYLLGKFAWRHMVPKIQGAGQFLTKMQNWHSEASWITFLSFASTGIGAGIATAAGALRMPFRSLAVFVSCAHLFWVTVWASIAYIFGVYIGNTVVAFAGVMAILIVIGIGVQWYVRRKMRT